MKLFFHFIFMAIIIFSNLATAENTAATQLQQQLNNIKTLQADFIQESFDAKNILLQKQTGNFKVINTGEFIWNVAEPYEQKIISDGKVIKIFDPDLQQVTLKPLDKNVQVIPLLLFGGEGNSISQQYETSSTGQDNFDLTAKNKNSLFEKMHISFKNNSPVSLSIIDSMNQKTMVSFNHVIVNGTLKASTFIFEIPTGIDVIDER